MPGQSFFSTKNITIIIVVVIAVGFFLAFVQLHSKHQSSTEKALNQIILDDPATLSPFELIDSSGPPFTNQSLQGRWAFLYFGYTDCQDNNCTTAMNTLGQVYNILRERQQLQPLVIFVSIQPNRDSSPKIRNYINQFNPNFLGLTGNPVVIAKMTQELGQFYIKLKSPGIGTAVDADQLAHTGTLFLINPAGKLQAVFSLPYDAVGITGAYNTIYKHYGAPFKAAAK